jgi:hypothetical protein
MAKKSVVSIETDDDDHAPGELALITVSDFKRSDTAFFTLAQLIDLGALGASRALGDDAAVGGGNGGLPAANGAIDASWMVNDGAAIQAFLAPGPSSSNTSAAEETATSDGISVATDKDDYQPGEYVIITVSDLKSGDAAYLTLAHLLGPGDDGVSGTADDVLAYDLTGTGSWTVVDGGEGDIDGLANGVIVTSWYVNDDAAYQEFWLSAARVLPNGNLGDPAITTFTDVPQPGARKTGVKYNDLDGDGVQDPGEPGIVGWRIFAFRDVNDNDMLDAGDTLVTSVLTGTNGVYSFSLAAGNYIIVEEVKAGWFESPDLLTTFVNPVDGFRARPTAATISATSSRRRSRGPSSTISTPTATWTQARAGFRAG